MSPTQYAKLYQSTEDDDLNLCAQILEKRKITLLFKRIFDIVLSLVLIVILIPLFLVISLIIVFDSKGHAIFKQTRIGRYGEPFTIFKFRTMTTGAVGSEVTVGNDMRITRIGKAIRGYRIDELPQLWNVLIGDMSFVGPRPESPYFVERYKPEWRATLMVRPGITCRSSIAFADEADTIPDSVNPQDFYISDILPEKCRMNILYVKNISLLEDIKIMCSTVTAVFKK